MDNSYADRLHPTTANQGRGLRMRPRAVRTISIAAVLALGAVRAHAIELSEDLSYLYTSMSMHPPTAERMTVCYGFGCRRRVIWDFTAGDRKALTDILAKGRATGEAERKAVQQAVI